MATSTVPRDDTIEITDDYALVFPPSMRETLGIHPGQKFQLLVYKGQIVLTPEVHPRDVRGSMPDLDTSIDHNDDLDEDRV